MTPENIRYILEAVRSGERDVDAALEELKDLPFSDLGFAKIDNHRRLRTGYPEVIFCSGKTIRGGKVIVVVAGMEGALPGVIGGLVDKPVIAVPTSVGYGANFNGLSALLTMLNSCAAGVSVVNIDNGFGAGYLASLINS